MSDAQAHAHASGTAFRPKLNHVRWNLKTLTTVRPADVHCGGSKSPPLSPAQKVNRKENPLDTTSQSPPVVVGLAGP